MSLTITDAGAERVRAYGGTSIRLSVTISGCSGMLYSIKVNDDEENDSDYIYESNGITIVVDSKSIPFLDGTEIDYDSDLLNGGFKYNNPNATGGCGCGNSFTTGE